MKTREELLIRERELKDTQEENTKLTKEIGSLQTTENYLLKEIMRDEMKLAKLNKLVTVKPEEVNIKGKTISRNQAYLAVIKEKINAHFKLLKRNCNASYQEKYKTQIEYLYSLQKEMKVSYITVKKLDISEEFLNGLDLTESINTFENLRNISKAGRLNYSSLKPCGPIMILRLDLNLTFEKLKEKCCEIWSLSSTMHCLYDEAFTNLECCKGSFVIEYFNSYQGFDATLEQGQVCFYLIDKLKHQRELLDIQQRAIDSKSESKEEIGGNSNNYDKNQIEDCINLIKKTKILKGIQGYKIQNNEDEAKKFIRIAKTVDNNFLYVILSILVLLFSIFSIASKKSVVDWSISNWDSRNLLEIVQNRAASNLYDMNDYLLYLVNLIKLESDSNHEILYYDTNYIVLNSIRFRFFRTITRECLDQSITAQLNLINKNTCFYSDHNSETVNKADLMNFKFKEETETNILMDRVTPLGRLDKSGIVVDINSKDKDAFSKMINKLSIMADKSYYHIKPDIQAIELQYTLYENNKDLFIHNLILVQKDANGFPTITIADSTTFLTNMYETSKGKSIKSLDFLRIIFYILLLSSIPLRIIQKYTNSTNKGIFALLKIIFVTLFTFKNLLLIFSVGFMFSAFISFNNYKMDTSIFFTSTDFYDFYPFALKQKEARILDQMSIYFILIYCFKYLQYFESIRAVLISLKKASYEYFMILSTICVFLLSLTFLTNFVYGTYVFEHRNFLNSIVTNIKFFILVEDSSLNEELMISGSGFAVFIYIFYIFVFKYFLVYLFFPIFMEYFRIESDKIFYLSHSEDYQSSEKLTFKESKIFPI